MSDGGIEGTEEVLMSGRQDDQPASGFEQDRRGLQLLAIVLDMLENVDIDNGVEAWTRLQALQRSAHDLVTARCVGLLQVHAQPGRH